MKRKVLNSVLRSFKNVEKTEECEITDAADESEYLLDEDGHIIGINILFSCSIEPRRKRSRNQEVQ